MMRRRKVSCSVKRGPVVDGKRIVEPSLTRVTTE